MNYVEVAVVEPAAGPVGDRLVVGNRQIDLKGRQRIEPDALLPIVSDPVIERMCLAVFPARVEKDNMMSCPGKCFAKLRVGGSDAPAPVGSDEFRADYANAKRPADSPLWRLLLAHGGKEGLLMLDL